MNSLEVREERLTTRLVVVGRMITLFAHKMEASTPDFSVNSAKKSRFTYFW